MQCTMQGWLIGEEGGGADCSQGGQGGEGAFKNVRGGGVKQKAKISNLRGGGGGVGKGRNYS